MKPYSQHDEIQDKGKATPHPYNPGSGKGASRFGGIITPTNVPNEPNSRVRMSKKQRIVMRDKQRGVKRKSAKRMARFA